MTVTRMAIFSISIAGRLVFVTALLLGVWAIPGCGSSSTNKPAPATAAGATHDEDDVAASLAEHHRYHHHGGVTLIIAMSLDTLGVSPDQRDAVEKIRTALHARMQPARVAEQNLVTILASGLATSNFDQEGVDAAVAQVTAAATAIHEATADSLNELHTVLTPAERASLVDKVESHWAVWQKANTQENASTSSVPGQLAEFATSLSLTTEQANEVHTRLNESMKSALQFEPQKVAEHLRAFSDAFRGDKFDARALSSASDANAQMAGWGAAYLARFVQALSPVLNSEQRSKFAQLLHEHAAHNPSEQGSP